MNVLLLPLAAAPVTLISQVVTVVIAFFIVLWILNKLAWKPVIALIDERRKTISDEFERIDSRQAELTSRIKDYEERLRQIDAEARERMNQAIEEGRRTATELLDEARVEAEAIRTKAQADIKLEIEKTRVLLRNAMVDIAIGASEKLLRAELNDERHRALVGQFVEDLAKARE